MPVSLQNNVSLHLSIGVYTLRENGRKNKLLLPVKCLKVLKENVTLDVELDPDKISNFSSLVVVEVMRWSCFSSPRHNFFSSSALQHLPPELCSPAACHGVSLPERKRFISAGGFKKTCWQWWRGGSSDRLVVVVVSRLESAVITLGRRRSSSGSRLVALGCSMPAHNNATPC